MEVDMTKRSAFSLLLGLLLLASITASFTGCGKHPLEKGPFPCLLMTQSVFEQVKGPDGRMMPKPGPATLVIVRKTAGGWEDVRLQDSESNVFHKAMMCPMEWKPRSIITIGAMEAALKIWTWDQGTWQAETVWKTKFGGKWDRLRDIEIGDVTGDGVDEMVVATHDQGVIGVVRKTPGGWEITELNRTEGTFVHEIEIGDVDGDGKMEFFATPSEPNKATMESQPGQVIMYRWDGGKFKKTIVDSFTESHAKEILAADLDGDGISTLFSVREAVTRKAEGTDRTKVIEPVQIIQYSFDGSEIGKKVVVTLDDHQCRFLAAGDVDGDGMGDLVAATMKSGLWIMRRQEDGGWVASSIDRSSSGYEHTTLIADLEKDGKNEIYVAADDQEELRMYEWDGVKFVKEVMLPIEGSAITWNLMPGTY